MEDRAKADGVVTDKEKARIGAARIVLLAILRREKTVTTEASGISNISKLSCKSRGAHDGRREPSCPFARLEPIGPSTVLGAPAFPAIRLAILAVGRFFTVCKARRVRSRSFG